LPAALVIAPVTVSSPAPPPSIALPAGGGDAFAHMLRSAQDGGDKRPPSAEAQALGGAERSAAGQSGGQPVGQEAMQSMRQDPTQPLDQGSLDQRSFDQIPARFPGQDPNSVQSVEHAMTGTMSKPGTAQPPWDTARAARSAHALTNGRPADVEAGDTAGDEDGSPPMPITAPPTDVQTAVFAGVGPAPPPPAAPDPTPAPPGSDASASMLAQAVAPQQAAGAAAPAQSTAAHGTAKSRASAPATAPADGPVSVISGFVLPTSATPALAESDATPAPPSSVGRASAMRSDAGRPDQGVARGLDAAPVTVDDAASWPDGPSPAPHAALPFEAPASGPAATATAPPAAPMALPSPAPAGVAATQATPDRKTIASDAADPRPGSVSPQAGDNPALGQMAAFVAAPPAATQAAAVAATSAHPASVAEQIAPTLLTLAKAPNGTQQMTVRLHPADLGMVQVRIERAISGMTQIEITADRPETLQALRRDQPALHRTLDEAGIPAAGRTVTFHAVQPSTASSEGPRSNHGIANQGLAGRPPGGGTDAGGSANGGKSGGSPSRETNRWFNGREAGPLNGAAATVAANIRTYRVGLDITA
jgi:flagellar hook-length control protein FliK